MISRGWKILFPNLLEEVHYVSVRKTRQLKLWLEFFKYTCKGIDF